MATQYLAGPFVRSLSVIATFAGTLACSGVPTEGDFSGEPYVEGDTTMEDGDQVVDVDELGVIEQQISAQESCDTVAANKTIAGVPGVWTASATYNINGCVNGYRLDANDYDLLPDGGKGELIRVAPFATYGGSTPTTKAGCEKTRVLMYVWERKSGGRTTYLGNESKWGEWFADSSWCFLPEVFPEFIIGPTPDGTKDYRIVVAARLHEKALDSNSKYARAKIKFDRLEACDTGDWSCSD